MKNTKTPSPSRSVEAHFDVFISHASEDKDAFVRGLAAELVRLGLRVWYDEATLTLGDILRQKIDEGLAYSTFGVVVLSHAFFSKNWPQAELDALFAREMAGRKVILPIWHRISKEEVLKLSPLLATKLAAPSDKGVVGIAQEIYSIVRPNTALPASSPSHKDHVSASNKGVEPLFELLRTIDDVSPLLHKLDQTLVDHDAMVFLQAMQRFFNGCNILTEDTDRNLRFGTDNLLRVLACEINDPHYMIGKLATAQTCFEDFRKRAQIGDELLAVGGADVNMEIRSLHALMHSLIDVQASISVCDRLCLRLIVALLAYGKNQHPKDVSKRFPEIPHRLHQTLREYLSEAFKTRMNVAVPDPLDDIWEDVQTNCQPAWETLQVEYK